jgi:uncharacterized membrane protein
MKSKTKLQQEEFAKQKELFIYNKVTSLEEKAKTHEFAIIYLLLFTLFQMLLIFALFCKVGTFPWL